MSAQTLDSGRTNQKMRTRRAILAAARRLIKRGEPPSLDEIAAEAQVSRATAYRYFPGLDALLSEAAVEALMPQEEDVLAGAPADPAARLALVDDLFDRVCREGDVALRLMLSRVFENSAKNGRGDMPLRQNRRTPLIESALAPIDDQLAPQARDKLVHALAVIIGPEAYVALGDVVGLGEDEAREVRRWAIGALLEAAQAG